MTRRRAVFSLSVTTVVLCVLAIFIFLQLRGVPLLPPAATPGFYQVTKVIDGDTIEVAMGDATEKIRMIGIDTPETKKPNSPVQCYGPEASEFAAKTLQHTFVRLEADPTNDNRDRYGRLLRYVYLQDGTLFAQAAITGGYAFAYVSFPFVKKDEFAAWQQQAQAAKAGLWGVCLPHLQDGRWQSDYSAAASSGRFLALSFTITL